ncbi:ribbon-helix-helix domain-containing protein [Methanolobus sp. WCC5]
MTEKNIVSFDAPDQMFAKIEELKTHGGYKSRSEAVRDLVRKGMEMVK